MPTALTFFSGAGGMCAGLAQARFDIIGGNEWDPLIADIWDANHLGLKCDRRSILDIPIAELPLKKIYRNLWIRTKRCSSQQRFLVQGCFLLPYRARYRQPIGTRLAKKLQLEMVK
jgi:site-specific DNA-cytosine methylase